METIKNQVKRFEKQIDNKLKIVVFVRHDDSLENGHNSTGITANMYLYDTLICCGDLENEIKEYFPELREILQFNGFDTENGPMHYISNALYFLGFGKYGKFNEKLFKKYVCFGVCPEDKNVNYFNTTEKEIKDWLLKRLPTLKKLHKQAIENLGMKY